MTVPPEIVELLGWRGADAPNIADKSSATSRKIAGSIFEALNVNRKSTESGQTLGSNFESAVRHYLGRALALIAPDRSFEISSKRITDFAQYQHLARIEDLLQDADPSGTLRAELGTDYIIKPDVTVALPQDEGPPFLHGAVSCKWTIRSDRVQNIRHEGVILTRHRRGRQPHVVTVTCEPLPSRLAAIARGTGEVDCVYHATLDELYAAVSALGGGEQDVVEELIEQDRLRPLDVLPEVLGLF